MKMKKTCLIVAIALASLGGFATAAPTLSLTLAGGSQTSASITAGTSSLSLDLHLNSDGNAIGGLQSYLTSTASPAVTYGAGSVALGTPFTAADVLQLPTAGTAVDSSSPAVTLLFDSALSGDYPANSSAVVSYTLNTSAIGVGSYTFTPVGQYLTNASSAIDTFGAPGTFTLNVTPAATPEPASLSLAALGLITLAARRRR